MDYVKSLSNRLMLKVVDSRFELTMWSADFVSQFQAANDVHVNTYDASLATDLFLLTNCKFRQFSFKFNKSIR